MKRKTNAELIALLNKVTIERDTYCARMDHAEKQSSDLRGQVIWHKQMNQQLIEALHAGAKEGSWPRRQS